MDSRSMVQVDERSVLARWPDWPARGRGRPVAALGSNSTDATLVVSNEVLVDADDPTDGTYWFRHRVDANNYALENDKTNTFVDVKPITSCRSQRR